MLVLLSLAALMLLSASGTTDEYRGWWVSTVSNGILSQSQVDQLLGVPGNANSLGDIRNANCNAVFVQVRRDSDVCYVSGMGEPFLETSPRLSPTNFDSLQAIINAAHDTTGGKKRIEVHAWMVVFRTDSGTVYSQHHGTPTGSLTNLDNYWLTRDSAGAEDLDDQPFDPGHPLCEDYITKVFLDVANNYDVDGVHYDYIRFLGSSYGYNPTSVARYNNRYGLSGNPSSSSSQWKQWRRDQVTSLVRRIYAKMQVVKPSVKISGAFIGGHPAPTTSTRAGFTGYSQAYNSYFQDWDSWLQEGIVDIAVPMTYFVYDGTYADDWVEWLNFDKDRHGTRQMVIGPGTYLNSQANALQEILETRTASPSGNYADGFCGYVYQVPYSGGTWSSWASTFKSTITPTWADVPEMTWKTAPTKGYLHGTVLNGAAWVDGAYMTISGAGSGTQYTDGTGFYGFVELTPGTYTVTCNATAQGLGTQTATCTVAAGQVSVVNFTWGTTTGMSGYVRTTGGIGVSGARIVGANGAYLSTSAADGSYTLPGMTAGTHSFKAAKTNYTTHTKSATVTAGATATVNFTIDPITSVGTISGYVRDNGGVGVGAADVATRTGGYSTTTDSSGFFSLTNVIVGTYSVTASKAGYTTDTVSSVIVTGGSTTTIYPVINPSGGGTTVTVDNVDAGWSITTGAWSTGSGSGMYGADYRFADTVATTATASCAWTPNLPSSGSYDVYIWYRQGTNRANNAPFTINYQGGSSTVYVDQSTNGGSWYKIGTSLPFAAGTAGNVTLDNSAQTPKVVMADAVQFVYAGPIETTPPTVPTGLWAAATSTTQMQLSWAASTDASGIGGYKVYRNGSLIAGSNPGTSYTDSGLAPNTSYSYTVAAYDIYGNTSSQCGAVSKSTLCLPISLTCDKPVSTWQTAGNTFTFTNTAGFGGQTISHIRYVWDRTPSHTWTNSETSWTNGTKACAADPGGNNWYLHARAYNADNVPNGQVDLGPYYCDTTAPADPVPSVAKYTIVTNQLTCSWTPSTDSESGLAEYQYSIGTTPGGTNIRGWTSTGTTPSVDATGLTLELDQPYYFSVKARNNAGLWSVTRGSTSTTPAHVCASIAEAKTLANNCAVVLTNRHCSYADGRGAFIQDPNRVAALYLPSVTGFGTGNIVEVAGILGTSGLHRILTDADPNVLGGSAQIDPLAMTCGSLGGAALNPWTPRLPNGRGANNLGLLVRVYGNVTSSTPTYFMISDGTGEAQVKSTANPGSGYVIVTGISSWTDYYGQTIPMIITRYPSDVQLVQ